MGGKLGRVAWLGLRWLIAVWVGLAGAGAIVDAATAAPGRAGISFAVGVLLLSLAVAKIRPRRPRRPGRSRTPRYAWASVAAAGGISVLAATLATGTSGPARVDDLVVSATLLVLAAGAWPRRQPALDRA